MAQEIKYSKGNAQTAESNNLEQQKIRLNELDGEYNRQLRQLKKLVKKAGIKFGDFSQLNNKEGNS